MDYNILKLASEIESWDTFQNSVAISGISGIYCRCETRILELLESKVHVFLDIR